MPVVPERARVTMHMQVYAAVASKACSHMQPGPRPACVERVCTGNTGGRSATTVAVATAATMTAATAAAAMAAVHGGGVEAESRDQPPTPMTQPLPPGTDRV